ncbi:MAG: CHAT domain-containing protein [Planctomycetaceae bacterium]|nr:CHAT domain-containing protein [Planctomycetaceae bacterium]
MLPFVGHRPRVAIIALLAVATLLPLPTSSSVQAQLADGRAVPRESYFLSLDPYYSGDYRTAMRGFRSAARSGIRSIQGRWVDSICYFSMMGECFYHMGDLPAALEQHELALRLFANQTTWMKRIQWPATIAPAQVRQLPWGPSTRQTIPGQFPDTLLSRQGNDPNKALRQGGLVRRRELIPVRAMEIMRCIGVSIRRRNEILGPLAPQEALSAEVVNRLSTRQVKGNNWINVLVDTQLGLAKLSTGADQEALRLLKSSLTIGGRLDHPLTGMALVEIGKLALAAEEYEQAAASFYEATFSAAQFNQADVLEEAFVLAAKAHRLAGGKSVFPPLQAAAIWTDKNRMERASAAILMAAAETTALLNQPQAAVGLLKQSKAAMNRSDLPKSNLGTRLIYDNALVAFQLGDSTSGLTNLNLALKQKERDSLRLFRIARTTQLQRAKIFSPRVASLLYAKVLREPTDKDWILNPFETLTYCVSPQEGAMRAWLSLAIERDETDAMVEVSDRIRRNRFFMQLPLGGRLLALRWVLAAPQALLGKEARQQRKNLLEKFPTVANIFQKMTQIEQSLKALPATTESADEIRQYEEYSKQLASLAAQQEAHLLEIALRPEPATRLFPPIRTVESIQSQLRPGQAVLILIDAPKEIQAVLLSAGKQYTSWKIKAPARIKKNLVTMMQTMGNYNKNQVLDAPLLTDEKWKATAEQLFSSFQKGLSEKNLQSIQELTIVPDGFLWYLPFEILQAPTKKGRQPLIELTTIHYAPTAGLAMNDPRPLPTGGETAIVVGRLFGRESDSIIQAAAGEIRDASARPAMLKLPLPADSSILGSRWDKLVVLDDIKNSPKQGFNWAPAQIDERNGRGSKVAAWMELPWAAPQQVILPGYHTAAEDGLRGRFTGDEIFLATTGLMASGVRTILISRWRTGGQISMELIREFLLESSQESAAAAWQRSLLLARSTELDPTQEPRLKGVKAGQVPTADHPFFWSGFMLLDTGSRSAKR